MEAFGLDAAAGLDAASFDAADLDDGSGLDGVTVHGIKHAIFLGKTQISAQDDSFLTHFLTCDAQKPLIPRDFAP
jgi:hypothetical protein